MKNSKMSLKMLLVKSIGSILMALPITSVAGNGGAYNGPTFSTVAIPGSVDRGISKRSLDQVIQNCIGVGNTTERYSELKNSYSFVKQVASSLGFNLNSSGFNFLYPSARDMRTASALHMFFEASTTSLNLSDFMSAIRISNSDAMDFSISVKVKDKNGNIETVLLEPYIKDKDNGLRAILFPLPYFSYKSAQQDIEYDQLGRVVNVGKLIFNGISIVTSHRVLDLYNVQTKKYVVSINMDDLVMCLQNEIQRYLE